MPKASAKYAVTEVGDVITMTFNDPAKTAVRVDCGKLPPKSAKRGLMYGVRQRLQDVGAGKELADHLSAARRAAQAMLNDTWEISSVNTEDLIVALTKILGKPEKDVRAVVEKATEEKIKGWIAMPQVMAEMAEIEAKRAREFARASKPEADAFADFK